MTTSTNLDGGTLPPREPDPREIVAALGRHWGILLSFGIIMAGLGVAVMVWPDKTIVVLAILLGVALLVSGVFSLVAGFTQPDQQTSTRVLSVISGILSILLGLLAFQGITQATVILAIIVGIGWVMRGIIDLVAGIGASGVPGRGLAITTGILSLIAGVAVLVWPSITLTVLAWVGGLWLVIVGLVQIAAAFSLRSAARHSSDDGILEGTVVA
jgi:uncharacterized membrane protein HdeD (DUF308 family)